MPYLQESCYILERYQSSCQTKNGYTHDKMQVNNGKIFKHVTLEKFPKPFIPYITSNKTQRFLLSHNREAEYKPTQYYITFRFQTELQKIPGRNHPILIPTAVVSTIKTKNYIKTISYDQSQEQFVKKWLDQVFIEAKQVRNDNKFAEDVPYRYVVPVIGFDCMQSTTTLVFMNLKSNKYDIIDRPGQRGCPIHVIVKSTENSVHLKFIDDKNYVGANMKFDNFLINIGKVKLSHEQLRCLPTSDLK
ncbi:MAG: hypothetical protein EZS28_023432 [Streblomastix strix]|uniref:Uncharacterized protein n=1 Tax=Streblomastix strix TaxID=222440 RepID=A0A5J4VET5_9EUKA|nr:MAG: hypothetical protein EZS28_023432 [Streblomastix strix]